MSVLRQLFAACALVVLASFLAAGCGPRGKPLARVGKRVITVDVFTEVARANQAQYPGNPAQARVALLDDMVRRELLLEAADRMGFGRTPQAVAFRRGLEERVLVQEMARRLSPGTVGVSDAEVAQFYEWRRTESHCQLVFTTSRAAADLALQAIRGGEDFAAVTNRLSAPGLLPPGGDLGFRVPGDLVGGLDRALREAPIGQVQGPIEVPGLGWFLIRVTERRPHTQPPLELEAPTLREMLRQRKQRAVLGDAAQELRDRYHIRLEPGGPQLLFMKLTALRAPAAVPPGDSVHSSEPTAAERAQVLVRYDGGPGDPGIYTLGDAFADLESGAGERPSFGMLPALEEWLKSRAFARCVLIEARRRHLAEEPTVARELRERFNSYLLENVYAAQVAVHIQVTPEALRAAYERRVPALARLQSAQVAYVVLPDSAAAAGILDRARRAAGFREAVAMGAPATKLVEEQVRYPTKSPRWTELESMLNGVPLRQVVGPVRATGGWMVLELLSREQNTPRLEALPPNIQQALQSEAADMLREARLQSLTDSLRKAYGVTIDQARLSRVPWPVPPAAQAPQAAGR